MQRRVVLIRHDPSPRDDRASVHLARAGFLLDWRDPFAGYVLGGPEADVAGTILYGGGQRLGDRDRHPYLVEELRWIERCMRAGVPVLGLCLGAQIVAHALGAAVRAAPGGVHEFGYYPLWPTEAGRSLFPEELWVAQAHHETFDVPDGAVLLARSERFSNQAIRYGDRTFAFQFHPECTLAGFRRWQEAPWAPWGEPGVQSRREQDALGAAHDAAQHAWFTRFLDRLFPAEGGED